MPIELSSSAPTVLILRPAFERAGLTRAELDERLNLTDEEFRVEAGLIVVGPLVQLGAREPGALDERLNLTDEEFRVEAGLIVVGPLASDDDLPALVDFLEGAGLSYFDDFFDLSGNWPDWVRLYARAEG